MIGSDLDKKIREAAAEVEEAWKVIGEAPGKKVWRVEKFKIVPWPEADYGCFYKGDSYIVLNSWTVPGKDKLNHDLHIWIGSESSQDEYGTAAYKMVEADDYVGGIAVQHREVEGHESYKFKILFSNLTYWQGGIESGFNHVEPTVEIPNMFKVKGTEKNMSLTQVDLSKTSLNKGDSFVLKASPAQVWLWNGESANPDEKARANSFAEKMCTEGTVVVLDQGAGDEECSEFWAYLGEGDIADADEEDETMEEFAPLLFKLPGDADGEPEQVGKGEKVKIGFVTACRLSKDLLDDSDVFLLDAGWEVFLWLGNNADKSEKLGSFSKADKYCKEDLRTVDLPLSIVKSGFESSDFNSFFG